MMNEINVVSGEQSFKGEKIRYIEINNIKYFLYTLNEKDDEGYEKLYINKIVENEEDLITDSEWDELKSKIPTIVKEIKSNNITSFKDLSIKDAKRGNLDYAKAFKLKVSIVDAIKKEEKEEVVDAKEEPKSDIHSEIDELLNELNEQEKSISGLDSFLDNVGRVPINPDNKAELELESLREELANEKKKKEELQNKIVNLQTEVDRYKSKLEQIKIMIERS